MTVLDQNDQDPNSKKLDSENDSSLPLDGEKSPLANNEPEDINSIKEQLERLRSTNERLLSENQQHKAKRKKAEEDKLLAEGKKDELLTKYQQELSDMKAERGNFFIADAIAAEAAKRGCPKWDHLYRLTNGGDVKYDDETNEVIGVKEFFDKYENDSEYSIYFTKNPHVKTENRTPSIQDDPVDYRTDPLGYLKKMKAKSPEDYRNGVEKLRREGILR